MAVMVRLSPQIRLPLSCSRATAAVSALAKRTMATRLSCSNSVAVKPQQQHAVLSCSRAMIAASAAASHGHLLLLQHKGGRHLAGVPLLLWSRCLAKCMGRPPVLARLYAAARGRPQMHQML